MTFLQFTQRMNVTPDEARKLLSDRLRVTPLMDDANFPLMIEKMIMREFFSGVEPNSRQAAAEPIPPQSKAGQPACDPKLPKKKAALSNRERTRQKKTKEWIQNYVDKEYRMILDTCSTIHKAENCDEAAFPHFLENIRPIIENSKNKLILPYVVLEEMEWLRTHAKEEEVRFRADEMLDFMETAVCQEKLVRIVGSRMDRPERIDRPFADPIILSKAGELRAHKCNVLVITQDRKLSLDLMDANRVRSVQSSAKIEVLCLNGAGNLIRRSREQLEKELQKGENQS